ncbi:hypothetical protein [Actinomadura sp. K4S16]|uniref:hypothetical protein n=1 Tax=Actinomadura sp. K4S16 TaxID=1316147 RepID=UPI0011EC1B0B|nr:hypothetical protein [Actinomadura sp. K4S16]
MAKLNLSPKILDVLDFGTPSAERDISRGLEKYFVESAAYRRVRSGAKTEASGGEHTAWSGGTAGAGHSRGW